MAVMSILDANEFDVTKSYFNKLKSKEEPCLLTLDNYANQELNEMVKAVIVKEPVEELKQGVVYYKILDYTESDKELEDFLSEHIDPTDIYTYAVRLSENYNDLRELTEMVKIYTEEKLRFIGGNLLNLEGTGIGFFSDSFINTYKLKSSTSVRFDFTQVKMVPKENLVLRDISEYQVRKTQVKKSSVKKERSSKSKTVKSKKKSMMDIIGSY